MCWLLLQNMLAFLKVCVDVWMIRRLTVATEVHTQAAYGVSNNVWSGATGGLILATQHMALPHTLPLQLALHVA